MHIHLSTAPNAHISPRLDGSVACYIGPRETAIFPCFGLSICFLRASLFRTICTAEQRRESPTRGRFLKGIVSRQFSVRCTWCVIILPWSGTCFSASLVTIAWLEAILVPDTRFRGQRLQRLKASRGIDAPKKPVLSRCNLLFAETDAPRCLWASLPGRFGPQSRSPTCLWHVDLLHFRLCCALHALRYRKETVFAGSSRGALLTPRKYRRFWISKPIKSITDAITNVWLLRISQLPLICPEFVCIITFIIVWMVRSSPWNK